MNNLKIGIIGGSGMEDTQLIDSSKSKNITTSFGDPSSQLITGHIQNVPINFISRHGVDHSISPSNVNYRANISCLKDEGCTHIIALTACGSLREKIEPGHFIFPDQFIDQTSKRKNTFFDADDVKHTSMGTPFSLDLRNCLIESCNLLGFDFHSSGTLITIEGPRFSTKAESLMFRSWGCDIINMSTVPEIILARELDMQYQSIGMVTDYDCWRENEEEVSMDKIYEVMANNVNNVKELIKDVIFRINRYYKGNK